MKDGKSKEIEELILQGKTFTEIVDKGFPKSTVSRLMNKAKTGAVISTDGTKTPAAGTPGTSKVSDIADANSLQIVPTTHQFSSTILFLAKRYTEVEWNWPEMSVGDWLDTYIYNTLKQRGVTLGYSVREESNENGG